jgi:2-amino-4-hydroxy-6-hydroxymethyldihydropteridine diphosphokinase
MLDTETPHRAFIALGSNLGVSADALNGALADINRLPDTRVLQVSPWYRSTAIGGPANQPDYLNAVCEIDTGLEPNSLLHALQHIEQCFGRERRVRWGPRTLDLDIVCYDDVASDDPELTLPHPRAHQRAFVMHPLADLAPTLRLQGQSLSHWLEQTRNQTIYRLPAD